MSGVSAVLCDICHRVVTVPCTAIEGRKIPDIEQILRTVRSAWNTPKSQRSHLQSQESRESSASNWDLSSLCDSYCCYLEHRRRKMGAGTYANAASPGPGLLRRRYSVPEIIMRKHTLAQQKTDDEPPWLQHDTNHNVIEVVGSKGAGSPHRTRLGGTAPGTPLHRKSFGLRQPEQERQLNGRSSSVESGPACGGRTRRPAATLTATGSDPNLASLKHRVGGVAFGVCSSPLCNGVGGGIGASRALATGTGGSLRSIHNNSLSCSSSSSLSGPPAVAGGSSGSGASSGGSGGSNGGKCGHHHGHPNHHPHPILVGGSNGPSPVFVREGDFSMRKTTLLRRMWSRELRRYERSGSWSPPLRRAPRRIYSIESIASVEGHQQQQQQQQQEDEVGRPGSSGSSVGSGRCATTATTTTTGTTSCLECAKLESQYTGGFGTGRSLLPRTVGPVESSSREPPSSGTGEHESREPKKSEQPSRGIDPTVDDRRQKGRRQQRMCSSQTADLGVESVSARIVVDGPLEPPADLVVQGEPAEEDDDDDEEEEEEDEDEQDLDPEGEYLSHSSSVSSIASQSYRVSGAPARANDHDLSDLSEFLQQEQLAARADVPGDEPSKLVNGVENDCEAAGQVAPVGVGNSAPGDHSRERAPVACGPAAAEARGRDEQSESTHPGPESDAVKQFPLRSAKRQRQRRPSDDSSVALSALSEDSDSTSASDFEDGTTGGGGGDERQTNARVDEKDQARLDEYISNLLLDNLNNLADAKELVLATSERDGDTILGVYSERRAQLDEGVTVAVVASTDRQNNNHELGAQEPTAAGGGQRASTPSGAMKQKLTEKYIGGGGGVVCNSPPQQEKRVVDPKAEGDAQECDKENEEDVVNNNNNSSNNVGKANHGKHGEERNHRRQKGLADQSPSHNQTHRKQHGGRSKGGGFYLSKRAGSRSPRLDDADDVPSAEVDLNGKYYFPSYGLETDPSDNTDIASEPEPLLLSKIGTGSTYPEAGLARGSGGGSVGSGGGGSVVVPRFSAMPRTESMEVQPSSTNSDEYDERRRVKGHADSDTDTDSDDSLVDSLDGYGSPAPRNHRKKPPPAGQPTDTTTTGGSSTDKSPRHEKGEAFFVPIHAETTNVETLRLHERVIVADTMPLKIKERLNNRRRLMKWKQEQENLKKQRKLMRTIEQRRFYGEPAIQVISTIDKAISRKEIIPPAAKKAVFGASARGTPGGSFTGATPFRAMKPKKRAATGAGSALRSELGMLESYKIDGKGNMQIQTPSTGAASSAAASAGATRKAATKSPWGQTAERRGQGKSKETPGSTSTSMMGGHTTASTTVGSVGKPSTGRTASRGQDVRRKQVLKDVQQMTLYPQADLTPDIEGGPRRMYQKTEIQEGDKHIEILEIVECADSAPRTRGRPARAHSGGRRSRHSGDSHSKHHRSRIPVPIYRFGHYRRSGSSREGSPLSAGGVVNAKVDRMIADLLLEALVNNPDDVGVKFVKTPEGLRDGAKSTKKSTSGGGSSKKGHSAPSANSNSGASNNNNLLTPRRTASGKYTQKFEVIPEERSSVSIESSTEELSTSGRKKPHPSPRRVSFDENHQILNGDELEGAQTPIQLTVPSPAKTPQQQPQPSPKHRPVQAAPVSPRKTATVSPAKSPSRTVAGKKQQGATATVTATTATTTNTTTTTSRGKAAIQSDVIEEKGWIGFSTQHEDMATPVTNGHDDEGWTVTVAGNYNPDMAPDVEMRLSFPKGASTGSTGSGGKSQITAGSGSVATSNGNMLQHQQDTNSNYHANGLTHPAGGRHHRQSQQQNYAVLDHLDGSVGYVGGSRNSSRAATLPPPQPPPGGLNPKRNLTRTDGTGAGTTSKDYRLPNVGPTHNILARPTAKKAIKTVECSVVASATRTIANNYHQLSHQHQLENHGGHHPYPGQPHHSYASRGPTTAGTGSTGTGTTTTTTTKGGQHRSRQSHTTLPGASAQPVLHPALQNGSGGKFISSSSPSLVSQQQQQQFHHQQQQFHQQQQQHPSQRFNHPESSYHLEDYGHNAYYDHRQQQHHPPTRRMSLDGQQQQLQQQPATMMADCLSIMGNAIAPELKPKVPTMSEKDLTRRHHPCYTRTQPYFS